MPFISDPVPPDGPTGGRLEIGHHELLPSLDIGRGDAPVVPVLPAEHVPHVGHTAVVGQAGDGVEGATASLVEPVVELPTVDLE